MTGENQYLSWYRWNIIWILECVYMVFHFGQNEIGVWSIYCNCLHDTTRNEVHCGCYFIAIILTEMGYKMSCKHFPKWNHKKGNICTCVYFIKRRMIDSNWMGCICWTTPETKFYFIYPKVKSNVNNFFFMAGWNFNSGRI